MKNVQWVQSSECSGGNCVEARSACADNACVEVGHQQGMVLVRDSKDPGGPVLQFDHDEWRAFVLGILRGELLFGVLDDAEEMAG